MTISNQSWHRRNLHGYGQHGFDPQWPDGSRLALQFVLNIEEGAEHTLLNGDNGSEHYLAEIPGAVQIEGLRNYSAESLFDFGSRVGVWRLLRLFEQHNIPLTAFACGRALELNPELGMALAEQGHEIAGHGYRWIDYRYVSREVERDHIQRTCQIIQDLSGAAPVGWYTGRVSANTRQLLNEIGGFVYDSDAYADELPYWLHAGQQSHLVIPYSLLTNDIRYVIAPGCGHADDFFSLLRDGFDQLWQEGQDSPKMMTVGLHPRFSGQAARLPALSRFLDHVAAHQGVWICQRREIARHWHHKFPPQP